MLCGFFAALYQTILFIFYFFYFLFKGKPEWQKSKERACLAATKEKPICCLHSYTTNNEDTLPAATKDGSNKEISSSTDNATTSSQTITQLHAVKSSQISKQQQSKADLGDATQSDSSQKYKITVDYKGRIGCTHDVKHVSKYSKTLVKVSESLKYLAALPFNYTVKALTYCKDGAYSIVGGIRNLFLWRRSSSKQSSEAVQQEKSLAEQVTEALARQESRNELKRNFEIFVTDTDAPDSDLNEKHIEKLNIITEPLKGSAEFYTRTEAFRDGIERQANDDASENSFIPPPPPPPPTAGITPTETSTNLDMKTTANGKMLPKGAVAVMPADLMAEASVRVREIEQKLNDALQRQASSQQSGTTKSTSLVQQSENLDAMHSDWAVSNRRLLTRSTEDAKPLLTHRSRSSRGYRTSETDDEADIGWRPQVRQIVSRTQTANDGNTPFMFSATKSPEFIPSTFLPDGGGFYMGESVFTPMQEVEEMRPIVNRRASATPSESHFGSRVNTPFEESALTRSYVNTPLEATQNDYSRPQSRFADAFARPQSRFAQNFSKIPIGPKYTYNRYNDSRTVRHRSHTTEPRSENIVQSISRRWPPASNASGVEFTKDNWNVAPSTITSCRRVKERSVTDKWTTRDESGRVVDEWGEKSWEGESSGLQRRSDGTGESWHRAVEVNPQGKTSFFDNRRLYTRDYVIESETRNI